MKSISGIVALTLFLTPVSDSALACEDHANLKSSTEDLPSSSLYQLDSKWVNENNKKVTLGQFSGRPRIVAMVYTKCQTACPLLVQDIKGILKQIPEARRRDLHVDLFSFESVSENSQTLSKFKSKYDLDKNWSAYAGQDSSVSELAAALGIQYKKLPNGEYIHSNVIFLLDKNGVIVAKHEGLKQDPSQLVMKAIKAL